MDSLITAAGRALLQGDPLGATLVLRPQLGHRRAMLYFGNDV
jgi:hypothetical protein